MKPDLLLINGRIWTGASSEPWVEAAAVSGESIIAVGSSSEIKEDAGDSTHIIDLDGLFACPGFIDSHTHFLNSALMLSEIQLRDAGTREEFKRRFEREAEKKKPGEWILNGDWDHQNFSPPRLPSRDWIDSVTPKNPVCVTRLDKHMVLVNSAALRIAGINLSTRDPEGGIIDRDPKSGEATGILKDGAMELITRHIPQPSMPKKLEAARTGLRYAHSLGLTSVHDMSDIMSFQVFQELERQNELSGRICVYLPISQIDAVLKLIGRSGSGSNRLKISGLKGFADGSLGSNTAFFFDSYSDNPASRGIMAPDMFPEGIMRKRLWAADRAGIQAAVHAIGDKANHLVLNIFEEIMRASGQRDRRWRIEHAQHLTPADFDRFGELNVIASVQPFHAIDDGRWAENKIGSGRLKTAYAYHSLLQGGAVLACGSDWNVAPLDPLTGIYAAVTRRTLDGKNPGGWIPEQRISLEQALKGYTINGAYAEFSETIKGTIEPGKLADMVVLDRNLFTIPPEDIRTAEVVLTICGGELVYQK
jgi:predicted amidohydrolase YtcJ